MGRDGQPPAPVPSSLAAPLTPDPFPPMAAAAAAAATTATPTAMAPPPPPPPLAR